jgi:hypothetical protein
MINFKKMLLICGFVVFGSRESLAEELTLKDISFMVGHWKGEGANAPEEQWYPPEGGIMPGFFRWPMEGGRQIFEMLTFIKGDDGITFRFKHFDPDITPWEKGEANTYKVTEVKQNCLFMDLISKNIKVPAGIRYCGFEDRVEFTGRGEDEFWDEATFKITMMKVESE